MESTKELAYSNRYAYLKEDEFQKYSWYYISQ